MWVQSGKPLPVSPLQDCESKEGRGWLTSHLYILCQLREVFDGIRMEETYLSIELSQTVTGKVL